MFYWTDRAEKMENGKLILKNSDNDNNNNKTKNEGYKLNTKSNQIKSTHSTMWTSTEYNTLINGKKSKKTEYMQWSVWVEMI